MQHRGKLAVAQQPYRECSVVRRLRISPTRATCFVLSHGSGRASQTSNPMLGQRVLRWPTLRFTCEHCRNSRCEIRKPSWLWLGHFTMPRSRYVRRKPRGGKGLIPPNPKQWENEHNGLDLRDELGLDPIDVLSPEEAYGLLENVTLMPHGGIPAAAEHLDHFRRDGSTAWSGMSVLLPDGREVVVFNDSHSPRRIRATLMEEFFHIRLNHPRSRLRLHGDGAPSRSFNGAVERQAYGSGAAALVPYAGLRSLTDTGATAWDIAQHYRVSRDLVLFRAKVTKTYRRLIASATR